MVTKKREKRVSIQPANITIPDVASIKEKVMSCLRSVYEMKDRPSMDRNIESLSSLFIGMCISDEIKKVFFDEIKFRLNLITSSVKDLERRERVILLLVRVAVRIHHTLAEDDIYDCLVDYCYTYTDAASPIVRRWTCILAHYIYSISKIPTNDDTTQSLLSPHNYRQLFMVLRKRWLDKDPIVRQEAIKALANIQNDPTDPNFKEAMECSAKEMISLSLGDRDSDVRIMAIDQFDMVDKRDCQYLLKIAHHDQDLNVQVAALERIANDMPFNTIPVKERVDLLERIIAHPEARIRNMLGHTLFEWLPQAYFIAQKVDTKEVSKLCIATMYIMDNLHFYDNEQTCVSILFGCFDRLLKEFKDYGESAILSMIEQFSSRDCATVNRINYKKLLNMNTKINEKAMMSFHWHNLIAFCSSDRFPENHRADCLFKLAPSMKTYAEFVQEFRALNAPTNIRSPRRGQPKQENLKRFCIIQLLKIFEYLDQDVTGMRAWKELLFAILSSRVELHPRLVEQVVRNLVDFHFPKPEDTEAALNEFTDTISQVMSRDDPDNTLLVNETLYQQDMNATATVNLLTNPAIRKQCLTIFHGMIKTGRFREAGAIIQNLFNTIVSPCIAATDIEDRILAYEAAGVISMFNDTFARNQAIFVFMGALEIENKPAKIATINILCELVLAIKYDVAAELWETADPNNIVETDDGMPEVINLHGLLNAIIQLSNDPDKQISFAGTETLCRWLLAEDRPEWKEALVHLILLSFRPDTVENPKLRGLFSQFFPTYASASRIHQMALVNVFETVMGKLQRRELNGPLAAVNEEEVAIWLTKWTSYSILQDVNGKTQGSVHRNLARIVLEDLDNRGDYDNYFVAIYCKVASMLEIDDQIDNDELDHLIELADNVLKDMTIAKNVRALNSLYKRLLSIQQKREIRQKPVAPGTRAESVANSVSTATSRNMTPLPLDIANEGDDGVRMDDVMDRMLLGQATPATPQRATKTPKTGIRVSNKKKLTVESLTKEFFARGRESALFREMQQSFVKATPTGPTTSGLISRLRSRTTKLKSVDTVPEEPESSAIESNYEKSPTRPKRVPRSAKIQVPEDPKEIVTDD